MIRISLSIPKSLVNLCEEDQNNFCLEMEEGSNISDLLKRLGLVDYEGIAVYQNGSIVSLETILEDCAEIKIYPIISGG